MINLFYVEDHAEECEPFRRLIQLAGTARRIETGVSCIHSGLASLGAAPLCDALLVDLELGSGIQHTIDWIKWNHQLMPAIIVVTGHVGYEYECLRAGAVAYWHKPDVIQHAQVFIDCVNQEIYKKRCRIPLLR